MMQIQSQLKANRLEIQNYQQQVKKIETQIADYQARLNLTPATEQELADISRGYEESKANYDSLLQKQNQSQLATSLEERQQGEQFRILDPPSLPARPSSPNHLLISLAGLLVGFAVGAVFNGFLGNDQCSGSAGKRSRRGSSTQGVDRDSSFRCSRRGSYSHLCFGE